MRSKPVWAIGCMPHQPLIAYLIRSIGYVRSKPVWANPHEERPNSFTLADGGVAQPIGLTVLPERGQLVVVDGHEHRLLVYALADGARDDARTLWNARVPFTFTGSSRAE